MTYRQNADYGLFGSGFTVMDNGDEELCEANVIWLELKKRTVFIYTVFPEIGVTTSALLLFPEP